jgi:hypothetical protein
MKKKEKYDGGLCKALRLCKPRDGVTKSFAGKQISYEKRKIREQRIQISNVGIQIENEKNELAVGNGAIMPGSRRRKRLSQAKGSAA